MDKYDKWKTKVPEDDDKRTTKIECCICHEPLYEGDEYYELEGDIYCEVCAENWLSCQKNWVSESMARGD